MEGIEDRWKREAEKDLKIDPRLAAAVMMQWGQGCGGQFSGGAERSKAEDDRGQENRLKEKTQSEASTGTGEV